MYTASSAPADIDNHQSHSHPEVSLVPSPARPQRQRARLAAAGLTSADERATTCCYARQDKFWVQGAPDGESWEIYTVLADSPTFYGEDNGPSCCAGSTPDSGDPEPAHAGRCC
jgi:hypothetical protein